MLLLALDNLTAVTEASSLDHSCSTILNAFGILCKYADFFRETYTALFRATFPLWERNSAVTRSRVPVFSTGDREGGALAL